MRVIWRMGNFVFCVQCVIALFVYPWASYFHHPEYGFTAALIAASITGCSLVIVAVIGGFAVRVLGIGSGALEGIAALLALSAAVAAPIFFTGPVLRMGLGIVSILLVAYAVRIALRHGAEEDWAPLFLSMLPVGIGMVIGGLILLWQDEPEAQSE